MSTTVNVAPSAEPHIQTILRAVDHLNAMTGEETYSVRVVGSEERIDGEIVLRTVDDLGANENERRVGNCRKTRLGVVVRVVPDATPAAIAHELGHAAGLEHVDDQNNLMYRSSRPDVWYLGDEQIAQLRRVAGERSAPQ